ncbi:MAG: multicopper oxidase domain-containing protein [Candidatus Marinimicrobia bacterium]|mgnify:CR=1 FL=1|jgi:bilirubin oxidase|nr:multicopper oxidase domain-containing protein [Candidatus Neomarinimicrobiota bacterium]MBT3617301.1 multicopper oxidase domain-containing protein [Candidatus Neomarinimicrobiota bacterium]MBT3828864.1 multicopper oxidase domain-containing protein [Candidatus Neomarinimicrobiota bacterium]MBT3996689.1 multicopper oxidase domain-containing protein [Candidatus Neomarinimicrobiota bacterium]MBT4281314.1 multicopper oxidase domain-containing protein [Candidatus Neomarinimicrobiota bacterium]
MKKIMLVLIINNLAFSQNQLIVPPALTGSNFDLVLQESEMEFFPGIFTQTMGVSYPILGPTLIMDKGEDVNITFDNQLPDTTTIHWHGMHVPAEFDGGPHTPIPPNTIWNPYFTVKDHASTMWYHPHLMHKTNEHVQMGIAGFVIVKDDEEALLDLPRNYGVDDIPLVFQTKTLNENYQIVTNMDSSGLDTFLFTNGTIDAYLDVPAQIIRLRLLNGSSERSFNIGLDNNSNFNVIGTDGGLLPEPIALDQLIISPGERYEVLIDLNNMTGDTIRIMNYGSLIPNGIYGASIVGGMGGSSIPYYADNPLNGSDFTLLEMRITSSTADPITTIPTSLVSVLPWNPADVNQTREIVFSPVNMGSNGALNGPFQFNGDPFDINVVNYEIPLNNVEIWELRNQSQIAHPFHIHDVQFNILEINGVAPPPHMQGWKDVVLVPSQNGTAKFITKFEDFSDTSVPYMYHCHILTHEETGMMGQFTVVDTSSVGIGGPEILVTDFNFHNAYPNPFNPTTTIRFSVETNTVVTLQLFDISGKLVTTLLDKIIERGTHKIQWNGSNQPSGIYFAVLQSGSHVETQKLILLK